MNLRSDAKDDPLLLKSNLFPAYPGLCFLCIMLIELNCTKGQALSDQHQSMEDSKELTDLLTAIIFPHNCFLLKMLRSLVVALCKIIRARSGEMIQGFSHFCKPRQWSEYGK